MRTLDVEKVLAAQPERRIQATHGRFNDEIATLRASLVPIIGSESLRVLDDLRGF